MDSGPSHLKMVAVGETVPGERQGTGKGLGQEQGWSADWAPGGHGEGGPWGGGGSLLEDRAGPCWPCLISNRKLQADCH